MLPLQSQVPVIPMAMKEARLVKHILINDQCKARGSAKELRKYFSVVTSTYDLGIHFPPPDLLMSLRKGTKGNTGQYENNVRLV
jgi:hypothetical protein